MTPEATWDASPEGSEETIAPVDDADVVVSLDGTDDLTCDVLRSKHHRITEITSQQRRIHKSRSDIRKTNPQSSLMSLLFERLQIHVLHRLRGRIGRRRSESLRSRNRRDCNDMPPLLRPFLFLSLSKIPVGLTDHPGESQAVRLHRGHFDILT